MLWVLKECTRELILVTDPLIHNKHFVSILHMYEIIILFAYIFGDNYREKVIRRGRDRER